MSNADSNTRLTTAEVEFLDRNLGDPFNGVLAGGITADRWLRERWATVNVQRFTERLPELRDFPAFLHHFIKAVGPAARSRLQHLGWADPWHLPSGPLIGHDPATGAPIYDTPTEILMNRTGILDARCLSVIERLLWEYGGSKAAHDAAVSAQDRARAREWVPPPMGRGNPPVFRQRGTTPPEVQTALVGVDPTVVSPAAI